VLPEVVRAAGGRAQVFLDGGIRRGTDVVKALALGADAVLMGRPYMFGLAANGEAGVEQALELMRNEIHRAMAFCGAPSVAAIDASLVDAGPAGARAEAAADRGDAPPRASGRSEAAAAGDRSAVVGPAGDQAGAAVAEV